ncbi:MAG: tyrosine--tRNA ligase, partial [Dehalococcoidales bacterium]|nr:tyrosine--tRNA ligase [Dehalococcoidales bacterium]
GRRLQEAHGQKPQICITFPVLVGTDGEMRMSKSTGNYIGVAEAPENIFGKIMSIPDKLILHYFGLLTNSTQEELDGYRKQIDGGNNPMEIKKLLGRQIVSELYDAKAADEAEAHFARTVQNKEVPEEIKTVQVSFADLSSNDLKTTGIYLPRLILKIGFAASMSEANRLIAQGGVSIDGEKVTSISAHLNSGSVIKVGKRKYAKIVDDE